MAQDTTAVDTFGQLVPVKAPVYTMDNYEQVIRGSSNMTLSEPENLTTEVEYDPQTGCYVMHTRVGETDITTPYLMSAEEYKEYSERKFMQQYWQEKIGEVEHNNEKKFDITDMKFDIGPADKIFGPGGVQLKLQGSAELLFGFKHQYVNNPALTEHSRNNNIFDFDEKIQASVNAKVGDKLGFNLNYNTEASFAFDQQNLKLAFKGEEDDIVQSLEAGNVTMDLNSSLIRGSQALFGVKTHLKFGKLSVQALISQQNSQPQNVNSEGGAQMTKYEVSADSYDENKHFFLSYYFRDHFESAMEAMPYVASGVTINRIEVWVTNKRGIYDQARNAIAFVDLGENNPEHIQNTKAFAPTGSVMPQNRANRLYELVTAEAGIRDIQQVNSVLQSKDIEWGIQGGDDYEKIESARLLSPSEYSLNATLGFITLKSALNQDEVLAVAFEYTYAGNVYQVGEFSTDKLAADTTGGRAPTMMLKMLKASNNAPHAHNIARNPNDRYGTWDLMLKNIYSLGASTMTSEKFEMYIMFRNDSIGTELQYLPEGPIKGKQLLRVMNLDRLDSRNNASPDGRFDYVEGYTAISSTGRIIFPVLEPFGSHLAKQLGNDPALVKKYCFQELYDSTLVAAQEMSEKNKFTLQGKYKGTNGSEIHLKAMNIPRGSVKVTAGGATLTENVDYTVDYTMGIVTILNEGILSSGTSVNVELEDQSTFSMQRKSLYGAHLEYEFSKDFTIGGTIMHLREKPLTTKVNTGSEPLANTIWGANLNYKTDMQWLSNALDQIPWITATAPSTFRIGAEFAQLIPGHTRDVGHAGTAYIDDFESTKTSIDIHYPSSWFMASTPANPSSADNNRPFLQESQYSNDKRYNSSRALLAWYAVDPIFGHPQSNTPAHIKSDMNLMSDHRTRIVYEKELYPNKDVLANEDNRLSVLNLSFYPKERGPYNIDADQLDANGELTDPKKRWGGLMRRLDNTDFEKANIEYIEFWLMDPQLTNPTNYQGGDLYIDLGDVSEDILRDGKKSFEHGLPLNGDYSNMDTTMWGRVSRTTSTTIAFANDEGAREKQDVGLNGLTTEQEWQYTYNGTMPYKDYADAVRAKVSGNPAALERLEADPFSPLNDPAGDNYHYYRGNDYDQQQVSILERYKHFNGTEGNSPETGNSTMYGAYGSASTLTPDIEDINHDNTMNEYEKYYEYHVDLRPGMLEVGRQHIAEKLTTTVTLKNGETAQVTWYQFKIPIKGECEKVGNIRNYRSIRFIRMYMTGFEDETHLRFATLDLVRGEWRNYTKGLYKNDQTGQINVTNPSSKALVDVQAINIEENGSRQPVNYVLPPGVSRQTDPGQAQLIAQNEQAMVLRVHNLQYNDALAVYKNVAYDLRNYKRLQMFVHAENIDSVISKIQDGELSCFIRLGSDMVNNYYEYEIPLEITPRGAYNNDNQNDRHIVWPDANYFDVDLSVFTSAKMARNKAKRAGNNNVGNSIPYVIYDDEHDKPQNRVTVLGNPTLEEIETIMIGVRNRNNHDPEGATGEVWVNELRLSEFNEDGGVAAMANASLGISDIAQVNLTGHIETSGYGSIESNVQGRNMEDMYQFSVSAALEAGRLFPEQAKLQIPLYVSYSSNTTSPKYDPLNTDIELKETLDLYDSKEEKDSIKQASNTNTTSTSFSLTNMKVDIHSKKKNMFYDPANFSISASYNKQEQHSPELECDKTTEQRGSFTYAYSFNPQPWEPFKKMEKVKNVKFLSEFNLYYLPQSWGFNTNMHRSFSELKMRNFNAVDAGESANNDLDLSFSKDFTWDRNFDFKYDLTKNLKFSFQTAMNSTVDEGYYTPEIIKDYAFTNDYYEGWKDTIQRSLAKWGRPYTYQQVFSATWNVPFNRIPYLECLTANASYNATYTWNRTATTSTTSTVDLGNTIGSTVAWQVDGQLNLETLYNKSKYWKQLSQRFSGRNSSRRAFKPKDFTQTITLKAGEPLEVSHRLGSENLSVTVLDANKKPVSVKVEPKGSTKVILTSKVDATDAVVTIITKDPNKRTPGQLVGDYAAYFGTMIRRVQVTYRQTNATTVPGFCPEVGFFGQKKMGGDLYAPGWDFAFGFVPKDFLQRAQENEWLAISNEVSQPALQANTSDLDIKVTLEPFPGFKIQVNGKRYQALSNSMLYSYDDYMQTVLQENMTGSFNITQIAIGTAFDKVSNADNNFACPTFDRFLSNREAMTQRVQDRYYGLTYPNQRFVQETEWGDKQYSDSLGRVSHNSADVLVPSFLAAYTGQDIHKISFNPFLSILHTMPNWSVTFDGLGRIPAMKKHFRSVTLTHAYTCKYAIGSYSTFSTWVGAGDGADKTLGFTRDVTTNAPTPSGAYDISSVTLSENFSPLIGLNMTMKNSLNFKTEYRKQRNVALNVTSVQLTEGHTNEFVVGAGYTIKDLSFTAKTKTGGQKKVSNDLKLNVDISYKDIKTLLRKVEENITQASSGNKVFGIKISADYVLSQKINLQFFYDHEGTTPLISTSYPIKSDNAGINIKLMLTR